MKRNLHSALATEEWIKKNQLFFNQRPNHRTVNAILHLVTFNKGSRPQNIK